MAEIPIEDYPQKDDLVVAETKPKGPTRAAPVISGATPFQVVQGQVDLNNAKLDKEVHNQGFASALYDSFASGGNAAIQLKYDLDRMRQAGPEDPAWKLGGNREWLKQNTALISGDQAWRYLQTKNATEAQLLLNDSNYNTEKQRRLARRFELYPKSTFTAIALSGIVDIDAPLTFATGGTTAAAKLGINATKIGRLVAGASTGAAVGVGVAGVGYSSNPIEDWTSIPIAGLGGAAFGIAGAALRKGPVQGPELDANNARVNALNEFGETIAEGNVRAKEDLRTEQFTHSDPFGSQKALDDAAALEAAKDAAPATAAPARPAGPEKVDLEEVQEDVIPEDLPPTEGRSTVGARGLGTQGPGVTSIRSTRTQDMIRAAEAHEQQHGYVREWFEGFDGLKNRSDALGRAASRFHDFVTATPLATDFQRFMRSGSVVGQRLAYELLENASGIVRNNRSGAMLMDHYQKSMLGHFLPYHDAFDEFAGAQGAGIWQKITDNKLREQFNEAVLAELNTRNYQSTVVGPRRVDPAVTKAADAIDRTFSKEIEINVGRPGEGTTKGYETLIPKSGYFPQKWLGGKMQKLINSGRFGTGTAGKSAIVKAISESYAALHPQMKAKDAQIFAEAVVDRALHANEGISMNLVGVLKDADGRKAIEDLMVRNGATKHDVDTLIDKLTGNKEEAGRAGHTKHRTDADMNFVASNGIRIMDLMDTDINKIVAMRARKGAGSAALARKGIYSRADVEEIKEAILQEQIANGPSNKTGNFIEDAIDSDRNLTAQDIDDMFSYFLGQPVAGGVSPTISRIRKLTNLSVLNQLGLTQIAEFGPMIAAVGMKRFMDIAGQELTDSIRKVDSPLVQELKHMHVLVPEERMFRDDLTFEYEQLHQSAGEYMQKFDNFLNKGQRLQGYTSGFYAVRKLQQRIAVTSAADKIARFLKTGAGITAERLRDAGFDPALLQRVQSELQHMQFDADGNLVKLNLDQWDAATVEDFTLTLNRSVNQLVQKAMAGESSPIFHRDGLAALFWHLKSFPMLALEKQTLRNARLGDGQALSTFLYGLATAGFAYGVKQTINGKTENLSPVQLARGAFGLSNMTGWIPMWADPLSGMLGIDSLDFSGYGSHGATSVVSIPVAATTLDKLSQLPGAAAAFVNPWDDLDTSDIRALQSLPIIGNLYGFTYIFNTWKDSAAKDRRRNTDAARRGAPQQDRITTSRKIPKGPPGLSDYVSEIIN
jgi:hypothetical protein